jgi:hypothetical protein
MEMREIVHAVLAAWMAFVFPEALQKFSSPLLSYPPSRVQAINYLFSRLMIQNLLPVVSVYNGKSLLVV